MRMKIYTNELGHIYGMFMQVLPRLSKLWPWADLDPFYAKVKFGDIGFCMGKSENYLLFGNCCSLGSQSCLKHSAKWVNEVEWVSNVKVILWPWSKVTQISKLNVWLLACIRRWAIQGLGPSCLLISCFVTETYAVGQLCPARVALETANPMMHGQVQKMSAQPGKKKRFRTKSKIIRRQCRSQWRDILQNDGKDTVCHTVKQYQNQTAQLIKSELIFHYIRTYVYAYINQTLQTCRLSLPSRLKGVMNPIRNCTNLCQ